MADVGHLFAVELRVIWKSGKTRIKDRWSYYGMFVGNISWPILLFYIKLAVYFFILIVELCSLQYNLFQTNHWMKSFIFFVCKIWFFIIIKMSNVDPFFLALSQYIFFLDMLLIINLASTHYRGIYIYRCWSQIDLFLNLIEVPIGVHIHKMNLYMILHNMYIILYVSVLFKPGFSSLLNNFIVIFVCILEHCTIRRYPVQLSFSFDNG